MSEDEYYANEPDDDSDDELEAEFLMEEPDDITLILMPKIDFDLEETLDSFYKQIKRSKNKEQLVNILRSFYYHIYGATSLMNDIEALQDRAKELEINLRLYAEQYR